MCDLFLKIKYYILHYYHHHYLIDLLCLSYCNINNSTKYYINIIAKIRYQCWKYLYLRGMVYEDDSSQH